MTDPQPSPTCPACADRGWLPTDTGEVTCTWCPAGQPIRDDMARLLEQPARDRSEIVGVLVSELTSAWTDRDREAHTGLMLLVSVHNVPVHMESRAGGKGAKVTGSPMPCAVDVENLIGDITAGALAHEQTLRAVLGYSRRRRSATLRSVCEALEAIPGLWASVHSTKPDHWLVSGRVTLKGGKPIRKTGAIERDLNTWHRQCRELLGADRRWARVPTTCTVCGQAALAQDPRSGSVRCRKCGEVWTQNELHWLDSLTITEGTAG